MSAIRVEPKQKTPSHDTPFTRKKKQVKYCACLWKHLTGEANACFVVDHVNRISCYEVMLLYFKEQVLLSCQNRNDQISKEVALRVRSCNDLVAVEARYHTSCRITFTNPEKTFFPGEKNARKLTGRPPKSEKVAAF